MYQAKGSTASWNLVYLSKLPAIPFSWRLWLW